ncbi:hypothetical protein M2101_001374 [Parabacteroides sp. PM5-20]|uniref:hypothetical protein n=1 Tax=Parabacteroides sp. PM5-20 TaxID=2940527 RepID=UPI00247354E3|nr:hypothetical protein [Parabacteroides sp. PM5-20]MDH6534698.1 hypothetical protein [Parabacteroides sp. PM5-20]
MQATCICKLPVYIYIVILLKITQIPTVLTGTISAPLLGEEEGDRRLASGGAV